MPAVPLSCPHCGRSLEVPEELLGGKVRCRECREVFVPEKPGTDASPPPRDEDTPRRPRRRARELEPCPYCGEDVSLDERVCPHCGKNLESEYEVDDRPWEEAGEVRRDVEPHRGGLVLVLGITGLVGALPTICCPLFGALGLVLSIPAWVMGQRDLRRMRHGEIDPYGHGSTQGGMICGIIGVGLAVIELLVYGGIVLLSLLSK